MKYILYPTPAEYSKMAFFDPRAFEGIPVTISAFVPKGEVWCVNPGISARIVAHEGPHAGQTVEEWLQPPTVVKILNLGDFIEVKAPKISYEIG